MKEILVAFMALFMIGMGILIVYGLPLLGFLLAIKYIFFK